MRMCDLSVFAGDGKCFDRMLSVICRIFHRQTGKLSFIIGTDFKTEILMSNKQNKSHIRWLLEEIPALKSTGILDELHAEQLQAHYSPMLAEENHLSYSKFMIFLYLIGAVMIAGGVLLLTAHNWDTMPNFIRLAITFVPLMIAAVFSFHTLFAKWESSVQRESSAILTAAGIASLLALVSQIYHIHGELESFVAYCLFFTVPLSLLFDSRLLCFISTIGLLICTGDNLFHFVSPEFKTAQWFSIVLLLPYIIRCQLRNPGFFMDCASCTYLSALLLTLLTLSRKSGSDAECLILFTVLASALWANGISRWAARPSPGNGINPQLILPFLFSTVLYIVISITGWDFGRNVLLNAMHDGVYVIAFAFYISIQILCIMRKPSVAHIAPVLLTVFMIICPLICGYHDTAAMIVSTVFMLGSSAAFFVHSLRKADLMFLIFGEIQLFTLISYHFFNTDWSILTRAIVFIITGLVFIFITRLIVKYFRKQGGTAHE